MAFSRNTKFLPSQVVAIPDSWVTDGSVNAIAHSADGNTIYIGGSFTQVGQQKAIRRRS